MVGGLYVLAQPQGERDHSTENQALQAALVSNGITSAMTDVTDRKVGVRYEVPENMTRNESIYTALGAGAAAADGSKKLILQVYENSEFVVQVETNSDTVERFMSGEIGQEKFEQRIKRSY